MRGTERRTTPKCDRQNHRKAMRFDKADARVGGERENAALRPESKEGSSQIKNDAGEPGDTDVERVGAQDSSSNRWGHEWLLQKRKAHPVPGHICRPKRAATTINPSRNETLVRSHADKCPPVHPTYQVSAARLRIRPDREHTWFAGYTFDPLAQRRVVSQTKARILGNMHVGVQANVRDRETVGH
jgi:hypothetical protein